MVFSFLRNISSVDCIANFFLEVISSTADSIFYVNEMSICVGITFSMPLLGFFISETVALPFNSCK